DEATALWKCRDCGKRGKPKSRLPTLSTSPLEISPRAGEIPTFPQCRRRGRWKSGKPKAGFPLSHRPESSVSKPKNKTRRRASPPARGVAALRAPTSRRQNERKETSRSSRISGSPRTGIDKPFQAHRPLESILDFRLICGLENAAGQAKLLQQRFLTHQGISA